MVGSAGKVMYFQKPADALAPTLPPDADAGATAMAAPLTIPPVAAGVPDVPIPVPGVLPPTRSPVADRPIPDNAAFNPTTVPSVPFTPPAMAVPPAPVVAPPAPVVRPIQPVPTDAAVLLPLPKATQPKPPDRQPPSPEVTQLPTRDKIFLMYDDATLHRAILESVAEGLKRDNVAAPPMVPFPPLPNVVPPGTAYVAKTVNYPANQVIREPGFVVHRRLHFEEKNAERYGWDLGFIQPVVSLAYFYKDALLWPNSLASGFEVGFWDTSAGKCLPGSPTPYYLYPPGLTITGLAAEASVITGGAFLLHVPGSGNALGPFLH